MNAPFHLPCTMQVIQNWEKNKNRATSSDVPMLPRGGTIVSVIINFFASFVFVFVNKASISVFRVVVMS